MKNEEFAIAFSNKTQEDAIREVSLSIKSVFPKDINALIILFTPHYKPSSIIKTTQLTLKPKKMIGLEAPFLIFEEKVFSKGIIYCCINKPGLEFKEILLDNSESQTIEYEMRLSLKKLKKSDFCLLSFMSSTFNPHSYLNGIKMSLGKSFNLIGAGFSKKYSRHNSQIINNTSQEGIINIIIKGLQIQSLKLENFVPLGKAFTITKASPDRGIITEINGRPAIDIYKYYLEEKFDDFLKKNLFSFYPIGIKTNNQTRIINILECLQDGSLRCLGEIKEKDSAHIMIMDSSPSNESIEEKLKPIKKSGQGLVFIINSLTRKKILKKSYTEEISTLKQLLGNNFKLIGFYADYSFSSDKGCKDINLETVNATLTLWE